MNAIDAILDTALSEDIGCGDITTESILLTAAGGTGFIVAKQSFVAAGLDVAGRVFKRLDPACTIECDSHDGDVVRDGDVFFKVTGDLSALLKGERVALNFLQRLSGVATLTREFVEALSFPRVRLTDTRKTTPGIRVLEKAAVRAGGAFSHRMSLYDGVLIKDNHIAVAGSVTKAVEAVRDRIPHLMKIEVETCNTDQVREALKAGADVIMLDNMNTRQMAEAVRLINGRALAEASGNVSLSTLNEIAATGVDVISCGALIHQARSVDISMRIEPNGS